MSSTRRTAFVAGLLYLLTFAAIPTLRLYREIKEPGYAVVPASAAAARLGGFLEVLVAFACIGTAVTLYPVLRRQQPGVALGFVAARSLEAAAIFMGVASLMTLVRIHRPAATSAGASALLPGGDALGGLCDMGFLLGQSLMPGVNAVLLGSLLLRSGLVPRIIPLIGLVGAPIHLTAVALTFFGVLAPLSPAAGLAALPIAAWEFSLGVYLVVKGFRPASQFD